MVQNHRNGRVLQFGAFELQTQTGEMRKHGTKIRLQGKPLQLLQALLDSPGDVVTREQLRDRLWAADTFVDFESGLNTAVNRLRLALGDSADRPRYVETLARSGYRFVAPVNVAEVPHAEEAPVAEMVPPVAAAALPPPEPPAPRVTRPQAYSKWPAAGAIAGLLLVAALLLVARQKPTPQPSFHQVTFQRTTIRAARFGPDGQSVIYESRGGPGDRELYLANTISPESRALGFPRMLLAGLSRSGELALITLGGGLDSRSLVRVPMNGGSPMPLDRSIWTADYSPDGSRMAVVRYRDRPAFLEYPRGKKVYEGAGWISDVRVSPSGHEVAFIDHPIGGDDAGNIMMVDDRGGTQTLSTGWASAEGLAWAPDGREVWFTATRSGLTRALYAVGLSGNRRLVAAVPGTLKLCDISATGRVLISREQVHAMMTGTVEGNPKEQDLSWFDYTTVSDISADGKVVLFAETGEGGGAHHGAYIRRFGAPSAVRVGEGFALALSPDGTLAVTRPDTDQSTLNLVPLTPGEPRTLSGHGLKYDFARFIPGGDRLLVGGVLAKGPYQMYTQRLDGSAPEPIHSRLYLEHAAISSDGTQLAGVDGEQRLVILPVAGGEPKVLVTGFSQNVLRWEHGDKTLLTQDTGVPAMLYRVDVNTGKYKHWKEVAPSDLAGVGTIWPMAVSDDERTLVYSFARILSELFVVDGWR